jgi:hypothetical protein
VPEGERTIPCEENSIKILIMTAILFIIGVVAGTIFYKLFLE